MKELKAFSFSGFRGGYLDPRPNSIRNVLINTVRDTLEELELMGFDGIFPSPPIRIGPLTSFEKLHQIKAEVKVLLYGDSKEGVMYFLQPATQLPSSIRTLGLDCSSNFLGARDSMNALIDPSFSSLRQLQSLEIAGTDHDYHQHIVKDKCVSAFAAAGIALSFPDSYYPSRGSPIDEEGGNE